jgi:hypothetical protein
VQQDDTSSEFQKLTWRRLITSRPVVGSSKNTQRLLPKAMAIDNRRLMPPDSLEAARFSNASNPT